MAPVTGDCLMTRPRLLLCAASVLMTVVGNAEAQFNGDHLDGKNREQTRFLNETLQETNTLMDAWRNALQRAAKQLQRANGGNGGGGGGSAGVGAGQCTLAEQSEEVVRQLEQLAREQRSDDLAEAARQLQQAVQMMRQYDSRDNLKDAVEFFEPDALYAPLWGEHVQGRDRIKDLLGEHLTSIQAFQTSAVDFTASGILAYQFGRVYYLRAEGATQQPIRGSYVAVFVRDGRDWKLRSYVERSDASPQPTDQ